MRIPAFVILMLAMTAVAELNSNTTDAALKRMARHPFRKVDGIIYDIRPQVVYFEHRGGSNLMPEWRPIVGEVIQILDDGLLVRAEELHGIVGDERNVFLRNYPGQDSLTDGKYVVALARRADRYQYTTVGGGRATVEAWDYGKIPSENELATFREQDAKKSRELATRRAEAMARVQAERERKRVEADIKVLEYQQKRAAEGSAQAQYDLALRYLIGAGVATNKLEAQRLLKLSADQDFAPAKQKLRELQ